MYKIKSLPEDFVVEEVIKLNMAPEGGYAYFWLKKKEYTTQRAVEKITGFLNFKLRDIGFAGNKDKQAVTRQAISIRDPARVVGETKFLKFNSENISLEYIGRGNAPISLGDLAGNRFEIILRDCDKEPAAISQCINYFDEQRFSETNKEVGSAIVKKDFAKACSLIRADEVQEYLAENQKDFVGAMKKLPLKTRMLHVNAYQSWLWNMTVSEYLKSKYDCTVAEYSLGELQFPLKNVPNTSVPIFGFGTELDDDDIGSIISELLKKENVKPNDFVIPSMPELSAEGGMREIAIDVKELKIEKIGKNDYKVCFYLPKGSYATMVARRMMA